MRKEIKMKKVVKGYIKFDFRQLYKNGNYIISSKNIYGIWNNLMYKIFKLNNTVVEYKKD